MNRVVWIDGERVDLAAAALIGQGGEAEIYDLCDGRVVKWWKPADHPDFAGQPVAQAAAERRLAEAPAKLRALPAGLPASVVAPNGLALAGKRSTRVVGFTMPRVTGTALLSYGEPRWRRDHPIDGAELISALLALHDAIAALHRADVVIGDCNDLNVLVDLTASPSGDAAVRGQAPNVGRARVHLIDVDSYQLAGFPCSMFSERLLDPRLCDGELVPSRPHDRDSDWFAFAAMAFRTLLGLGPWGGVYPRCPPAARALRRISALHADVVYPRAARPLASLPDALLAVFRDVFERDVRGEFPRTLLASLWLRRCTQCGDEHARDTCPSCRHRAPAPPVSVSGGLRWHVLPRPPEVADSHGVRLSGGTLLRQTRLGDERIGSVLAGQTRIWIGAALGVGFYRAGGYAVGFVFRPDRGGLDDRVALPAIHGELVAAHATIADDRAWLWLTRAVNGQLATIAVVIGSDASVLATELLTDTPWLAGIAGACASGSQLFVPTDAGIVRIELVAGAIACTRVFTETASLVSAADRLALAPGGIDVIRERDALHLSLN